MANPVVINDALWTPAPPSGSPVLSAIDARTGQSAMVAHDGNGPRVGIFYEGTQTLVTGTATTSPSMQVSVVPLAWCGQKALGEGVYIGRSTGTVLVDVAAAPAANSRYDVVYVMERDASATTSPDSNTQGEIGVITGVAGASPTKPAIPVGSVEVATLTVAAGATKTTDPQVTITTTLGFTTGSGGPIPVPNQATRDGLAKYSGLRVARLDKGGRIESCDGTNWGDPFADFYRGVGGTVPVTAFTTLVFGNQNYAEGGLTCSSGTFTVPIAGRYRCTSLITFDGATGLSVVAARCSVNGTAIATSSETASSSTGSYSALVERTWRLNANDAVTFQAYHNASAAIATDSAADRTWAQVEWVGP